MIESNTKKRGHSISREQPLIFGTNPKGAFQFIIIKIQLIDFNEVDFSTRSKLLDILAFSIPLLWSGWQCKNV